MSNPALKQATYEDLLTLPPNLVGEIVQGRLITHAAYLKAHWRRVALLADCFALALAHRLSEALISSDHLAS